MCFGVAVAGLALNVVLPSVSALLVAIVAGVVVANVVPVPTAWAPGVSVASKRVLRIGIVLLGLQLSLQDIVQLGPDVVSIAVAVVALGMAGGLALGTALRVPVTQRILIACGFSICGAAAVAAADGVIDADEEEVATGVGLVVLFGTLSIPLAPLVAQWAGLSEQWSGVFIGASVHEVAQVVASAGLVGSAALSVAVVVKLARVALLAPVMAGLSLWQRRRQVGTQAHRPPLLPLFVAGFIAAVLVRSFVPIPQAALAAAGYAQTLLLAAAMFALGLGVRLAAFRQAGRPVILGALATALVYAVALGGVLVWA